MRSKFAHLKEHVIELRKQGISITAIEKKYGIARSTLSLWFRNVELTDEQKEKLRKASNGWGTEKGKARSLKWHNDQKALRVEKAEESARQNLLEMRIIDKNIVELALAMLYLGEGSKNNATSMGNSNPRILLFFITVLNTSFDVPLSDMRCELHLRYDQDQQAEKQYWSEQLGIPLSSFMSVSFDKRTVGRPTREGYHGVCIVRCGRIAIMRKLVYLSNMFCDSVIRIKGD